jgi:hypothetical protein
VRTNVSSSALTFVAPSDERRIPNSTAVWRDPVGSSTAEMHYFAEQRGHGELLLTNFIRPIVTAEGQYRLHT